MTPEDKIALAVIICTVLVSGLCLFWLFTLDPAALNSEWSEVLNRSITVLNGGDIMT